MCQREKSKNIFFKQEKGKRGIRSGAHSEKQRKKKEKRGIRSGAHSLRD
jgi:hypothetical protein